MSIPHLNRIAQSEVARLNKASFRWLAGRLSFLMKNKTLPGAIKPGNYKSSKLFGVGDMFMYYYDAKWADKLPYWDRFPCTIVIGIYPDGFLGLNLHYLPPNIRFSFTNKLIQLAQVIPGDSRARMQISYDLLKNSQNLGAYVPCVKRYLIDHVRSKMMRVFPHEWALVVHMPVAQFTKASQSVVFAESRKKIKR